MRSTLIALAIALLGAPQTARSADAALLRLCADPDAAASQASRACAAALRAGGLSRAQRRGVRLNYGALLLQQGQPAAARDVYDEAAQADPADALALAGRADAHAAMGQTGLAAVDWNRAVAAAPRDPDVLGGRAAFRLRTGNPQGALADIEIALRRADRDAALLFNRGVALMALGRDAEAERAFTTMTWAHPQDAGAWLHRGMLRARRDPAQALDDLTRATALAPDDAETFMARAQALDALGRRQEADRDYRRAWELGHRSEDLQSRITGMGG